MSQITGAFEVADKQVFRGHNYTAIWEKNKSNQWKGSIMFGQKNSLNFNENSKDRDNAATENVCKIL